MGTIIAQCVDTLQDPSIRSKAFQNLRQRIEKNSIQFDAKQIKSMFDPLMVGGREWMIL